MDIKKLTKRLIYLIFFILILDFLANKFFWYSSIWYLDIFMHFLGGFWVGLLFFYLFSFEKHSLGVIFRALFFVFLIGVGWEVYEAFVNNAVAQNPFNFFDTASDIFFDLLGGFCAILYILVPFKNQRTGIKD